MTTPTLLRSSRGQAIAELALILPFLLVLVAGTVELGRLVNAELILTHLTREGANMTSRNVAAALALDAVIDSSCPLIGDGAPCLTNNTAVWRVIYTRYVPNHATTPTAYVLSTQTTRGALGEASRTTAATLPRPTTITGATWPDRHVVEVFYRQKAITPVGAFVPTIAGTTSMYDRTIF